MLKITICAVGSLKEPYWREAGIEYVKRLKSFCTINIIECTEAAFKSPADAKQTLAKEAAVLLEKLPKYSFLIALDRQGSGLTSEQFAERIEQWEQHEPHITFIIGGPLGLSSEILNRAREKVSLSKLTFTHQMTRIILLEQLYRAFMIRHGRTYHY